MSAILGQVGNPVPFWRDGAWEEHIGWSTPVTLSIVAAKPHQSTENLMQEQFGLLKFLIKLNLDSQGLHFPVVSGSCLGIRIPNMFPPG